MKESVGSLPGDPKATQGKESKELSDPKLLKDYSATKRLYEKLFFKHNGKTFDLKSLIGAYGAKLTDVLYEIDPSAKVNGSDPIYTRFYRRMKYLNRKGLFDFTQGKTGYVSYEKLGIVAHPTGQLFYLLYQVQNSNLPEKSAKLDDDWWDTFYKFPKRCSSERITAIKTLMGIQGRHLFVRDCTCLKCKTVGKQTPGKGTVSCSCGFEFRPPLNPALKKELGDINYYFGEWEEKTLNKELLFDRGIGTQLERMPCRTRFTDKGRKVHNLKTFDRAWGRANLIFNRGVFVTLTTDISLHQSLWHANRHLTKAFNRYLSLLLSRKKHNAKKGFDTEEDYDKIDTKLERLKYISAYEFQENGLIHLHLVFFGIRYLADIDEISQDWQRCGQGRIAHAYGVHRDNDQWVWNRAKPKDAEGRSPTDYLRKYLEKALFVSQNFSMYWAVNKRFSSMSRILQTKECQGCRYLAGSALKVCPHCSAILKRYSRGYRFLGSLDAGDMPNAKIMRLNTGFSPFDPLGSIRETIQIYT